LRIAGREVSEPPVNVRVSLHLAGQHHNTLKPPKQRHPEAVLSVSRTTEGARTMDIAPMKTTLTAAALILALGSTAYAQEVKPSTTPAAPAVTVSPAAPSSTPAAPIVKPVLAPETMQKVGAPISPTAPAAPAMAPKVEAKPAATPAAPVATKTAAPVAATAKLLNINTGTVADLEKLPKIGDVRAKQIVAGRPYKSVDELLVKKVLPQDAFDAVKGLISVQ
jgi:competence protein ComEA